MRRLLVLLLVLVAGCTAGHRAGGPPRVVAGAYPFAWLASQIGGPDVTVTDLVKPGAEPHDVELSPRQVVKVLDASVVIYLQGFQPAVDDAVQGDNGLDLSRSVHQVDSSEAAGHKDPHVWLDPVLMERMAAAVAERLAKIDPVHAPAYRSRLATVTAELAALDRQIRTGLAHCASKDVVTSHAAFAYFAARYGLVQHGIAGLNPDGEPSPRKLAEVARFARTNHVTTIFFESLVSPKLAQTVASEVGARTAVLDPIEGVRRSDDYLTVQRRNLAALRTALHCT